MTMSSTEKLAAKPDKKLRDIIAEVQEMALRTQSEAYRLVPNSEHSDIAPGDVIEIRCAPDPAIRVEKGAEFPPPTVRCGGFILEQDGKLYRCHGEPVSRGTDPVDEITQQQANDDPTKSIERGMAGDPYDWQLTSWAWHEIDPSFADRSVAEEQDVQLRVFPGVVIDESTVKVHPEMAFGVLGAPKQN